MAASMNLKRIYDLEEKMMTKLDSVLKSRDVALPTKIHPVKAMVFPYVMDGYERCTTPYDTKYDNRNGSEGVFVEVFINGEYHGLYCMTDKINRKLLGLKKAKTNDDGQIEIRGLL